MLQDSKVRGGAAIQILRGGKYEPKGETERRERERERERERGIIIHGGRWHRGRHDKKA